MSTTKIEWAEKVWNPVTGCTKVSPGCANCYAERMAKRLAGRCGYPAEEPFRVTFHPERLEEPLRWRKPARIFVCSMGDLFHEDVPVNWLESVLAVMTNCPQHTFIVLTKRANRLWLLTPDRLRLSRTDTWPIRNLWLGVTVEHPDYKPRIDILRQIPAAVRFISYEPALAGLGWVNLDGIDWVICGGETGPGARPMHPDWARSLRDQCVAAGVPYYFKQWGEWLWWHKDGIPFSKDAPTAIYAWPDGSHSFKVGKKAAGRLLDGRTWDQMPREVRG